MSNLPTFETNSEEVAMIAAALYLAVLNPPSGGTAETKLNRSLEQFDKAYKAIKAAVKGGQDSSADNG